MTVTARQLEGTSDGARAQLLFRQLNEQIRSLAGDEALTLTCECVNGACVEQLVLGLEEYEAVRRFPTHFVVKEGHVAYDVEREVESRDGIVVVEKIGADAEQAILLDPRRKGWQRVIEAGADHPSREEVEA